jgi:hypothetical protein
MPLPYGLIMMPRYRLSRTQTFATFSVLLLSPEYKYAPLQHLDETCPDYKQRIL